jgi:CheY-like chemotaxis protein
VKWSACTCGAPVSPVTVVKDGRAALQELEQRNAPLLVILDLMRGRDVDRL